MSKGVGEKEIDRLRKEDGGKGSKMAHLISWKGNQRQCSLQKGLSSADVLKDGRFKNQGQHEKKKK